MALTLQRKLELAGALSKVQPQLQRLHLLPEPKKRHRKRNAILIGECDSSRCSRCGRRAPPPRRLGRWVIRGGRESCTTGFPEPDALAGEPDGMS